MSTDPAGTGAPPSGEPLLTVEDLRVTFATEEGVVRAVEGVSFELRPGEILAVVGESGSGKSVTAMTLMGLTRSPNARFEGTADYKGTELIGATEEGVVHAVDGVTFSVDRGEIVAIVGESG